MKLIKISNRSMKLRFHGCTPEYIQTVCHSSCCNSSSSGTLITIHPSEEENIHLLGFDIKDGLLVCKDKCCVFKENYLCKLHNTIYKPFGCIASPFTLNNNNTLIVRNRYKLLKCYDKQDGIPAYIAFRPSLNMLFGNTISDELCKYLTLYNNDIKLPMEDDIYNMLKDNDAIKRNRNYGKIK